MKNYKLILIAFSVLCISCCEESVTSPTSANMVEVQFDLQQGFIDIFSYN